MVFLTLLGIPVIIALFFLVFGHKKVTLQEFAMQLAAQAMVAGICAGATHCSNLHDVEVWNGRVAEKKKEWTSCEHSYTCNCVTSCTTDSNGNQSCSTICQTCYEHTNDWDWMVYTTNRESITIDRVDRRGSNEPPRWTAVKIGEPTSVTHSYDNYIKAAPDTLFRHQGLVEKYKDTLLPYPQKIYDYYRLNRLVVLGLPIPDAAEWNRDLSELNADLGASKQVNVIVAIVNGMPGEYAQAAAQHWLGGKKNDVVVLVSANAATIDWVHVMAWTDSEMLKVKLRDDIVAVGKLDRPAILAAIRENVEKLYIRKPMSDFQYLEASVTPTAGQWAACMVIGVLVSIGLGIFFYRNEVDILGDLFNRKRRY